MQVSRGEDISVLLPDNVGTKDFAHEKNTKSARGRGRRSRNRSRIRRNTRTIVGSARSRSQDLDHSLQPPDYGALAGAGTGGVVGGSHLAR